MAVGMSTEFRDMCQLYLAKGEKRQEDTKEVNNKLKELLSYFE
jgi:hypothetical protein